MSNRAVAIASGINESEISEYKTGSGGTPTLQRLLRLAAALNCTVEDLVAGMNDDYDRVSELVRHAGDLDSGLPQDTGGSPDAVAASSRVLPLVQELVTVISQQEAATSKMHYIAKQLLDIAATGPEGDSVADEKRASGEGRGNANRKPADPSDGD